MNYSIKWVQSVWSPLQPTPVVLPSPQGTLRPSLNATLEKARFLLHSGPAITSCADPKAFWGPGGRPFKYRVWSGAWGGGWAVAGGRRRTALHATSSGHNMKQTNKRTHARTHAHRDFLDCIIASSPLSSCCLTPVVSYVTALVPCVRIWRSYVACQHAKS